MRLSDRWLPNSDREPLVYRLRAHFRTSLCVLAGWWLHDLVWLASADLLVMLGRLTLPGLVVVAAWFALVAAAVALRLDGRVLSVILLLAVLAPGVMERLASPIDLSGVWLRLPKMFGALALAHELAWRNRKREVAWAGALGLGLSAAGLVSLMSSTPRALSLHQGRVHLILLVLGLLLWAISLAEWSRSAGRLAAFASAIGIATCLLSASDSEEAKLLGSAATSTVLASDSPTTSPAASGAEHFNVILIVLDNLSALRLSSHGHARETMPALMRFANQPGVQESLDVRSASSWTIPSHGTLLTGYAPRRHGARHVQVGRGVGFRNSVGRLRPGVRTLAEELAARGFRTGAIVSNSYMLGPRFGFARGFEHFDHRDPELLSPRTGLLAQALGRVREVGSKPYHEAPVILGRALAWLDAGHAEQPYFLFLNLMDAHAPWVPPAPYDRYFSREAPRPPDDLRDPREYRPLLYDRQIRYLDEHLGRFLDELGTRANFDRTIIVITSDHGESFGQHGLWGHNYLLYEPLLRVPLIVKPALGRPGLPSRADGLRAIDTWRWIAAEVGIPPVEHRPSVPVAEIYAGRAAQSSSKVLRRDGLSWVVESRKVIVYRDGDVEVYDLNKDPGELTNVVEPGELLHYRQVAERWWQDED